MAVLLVVEPLALVVGAVRVGVGSHTLSFIVHPLSLVNVSICVNKFSLTICFVITPLSFITTAIGPELSANAVAHAIEPLASVGSSVAQSVGTLGHASILVGLLIGCRLWHTFAKHAAAFAVVTSICAFAYRKKVTGIS